MRAWSELRWDLSSSSVEETGSMQGSFLRYCVQAVFALTYQKTGLSTACIWASAFLVLVEEF